MKKSVAILAITLFMTGCHIVSKSKESEEPQKPRIKSVKTITYAAPLKFGVIDTTIDKPLSVEYREYNEQGLRTKDVGSSSNDPNVDHVTEYTYDSTRYREIKCYSYVLVNGVKYPQGSYTTEYKYHKGWKKTFWTYMDEPVYLMSKMDLNDKGNAIKTTSYNEEGGITGMTNWKYHDNGEASESGTYREDGTLSRISIYDTLGQEVKKVYYRKDGLRLNTYTSEYNSRGREIKRVHYYTESFRDVHDVYRYEYNENGMMIRWTKSPSQYTDVYEYTTKHIKYDHNGNYVEYTDYQSTNIKNIVRREIIYWGDDNIKLSEKDSDSN